jgi:hypothetical protein
MDTDRMSAMEQTLADLQARTEAQFQQILATMQRQQPQPIPDLPKPTDRITPSKNRTVRPATPLDFDGDRSKGMAFLNSCQTYLRLCPKEFPDEQTKIVWAMFYMKSGRAQKWSARIFRWEQQPENAGHSKFLDWSDFRDEFRKEFIPERVHPRTCGCPGHQPAGNDRLLPKKQVPG